jgi:hypothetical protein
VPDEVKKKFIDYFSFFGFHKKTGATQKVAPQIMKTKIL